MLGIGVAIWVSMRKAAAATQKTEVTTGEAFVKRQLPHETAVVLDPMPMPPAMGST